MIVCNNCGASYADDAPRCPYCGGDNFEKSVQVHEDTINDLKREKQQWEEKPQRVAKARDVYGGEGSDYCDCGGTFD